MRIKTSKVIVEKVKAGYSALYILSQEPTRAIADLLTASVETKRRVLVWTIGKGIWEESPDAGVLPRHANKVEGAELPDAMPNEILELIPKLPGAAMTEEEILALPPGERRAARQRRDNPNTKAFFVLNNFHHFLDDPLIQARIIDMVQEFKNEQKILILLTPVLKLPVEIEKDFTLIETELPDKEDLSPILDACIDGVRGNQQPPDAERKKKLVEASLGLTTQEAENAFALAFVRPKQENRPDEMWDPEVVMEEKCSTLRKTGLLEFYPPGHAGMKAIGGLQGLKDWVNRRKRAFTEEARAFGLPNPKGILMVGVPGTGKSLGAKALSEELGVPLLRCDMGRIYAGLVGASEANVRSVIRISEAVAPCVLWFDEIEKGLAGSTGPSLDSGVGSRVLGSILTWMQEKKSSVFVYATANKVSELPPEFLRKGRFDEIFGVDLPNKTERREIWQVQLRNFKREQLIRTSDAQSVNMIDLDHFVEVSEGYSGAEIEAVIKEGLFMAFSEGRDLGTIDLQESIDTMVPLSTTMGKEVDEIRKWLEKRARSANKPEVRPATSTHGQVTPGQRILEA